MTVPVNEWRATIKRLLSELAAIPYPEVYQLSKTTVFDDHSGNYLVLVHGWEDVPIIQPRPFSSWR